MTNLEPIVRKLIETGLYKYHDVDHKLYWHAIYGRQSFKKLAYPDESQDQVIDWFYYQILQCELEDKKAETHESNKK